MTIKTKITDFLGLKKNITLLLGAILMSSLGERVWLGFAPKYLETLGAGILLIGLFDALQTLLGALYSYPGAWLTDRFGQRKALLLFSCFSLVGYFLVLFWPSKYALLVGVFFFVAWSSFSLPATFSVVARNLHQSKYSMGIGIQSMIRRVPMIIGPLLGGWIITHWGWKEGVRVALWVCIFLSLCTLLLQASIQDSANEKVSTSFSLIKILQAFPKPLKELLISDILIRFCERIPYAFVILWAIDQNGLSAQQFGWLTAVEMATAMIFFIPVAHLSDKHGQKPFVLATFVFFTLFPLALYFSHSFSMLLVAFIIRGLKEFGEPARKAMIIHYSPKELQSMSYGVYYLIRDTTVTTGSFIGAFLWKISPEANFLGAAICGLLGTVWFYWNMQYEK